MARLAARAVVVLDRPYNHAPEHLTRGCCFPRPATPATTEKRITCPLLCFCVPVFARFGGLVKMHTMNSLDEYLKLESSDVVGAHNWLKFVEGIRRWRFDP